VFAGCKADQVGNRPLGMIENGVQEAVIDRDIALSGCFQQGVDRNTFIVSRIEDQVGAQRVTTLLL